MFRKWSGCNPQGSFLGTDIISRDRHRAAVSVGASPFQPPIRPEGSTAHWRSRRYLDCLVERVRRCYHFQDYDRLCIDEAIAPCATPSGYKVHIKGKPHTDGLRLELGVFAGGCIAVVLPYAGKKYDSLSPTDLFYSVAKSLPEGLRFMFYADRYYSTLDAINVLKNFRHEFCGSIKITNAGLPRYKPSLRGAFHGNLASHVLRVPVSMAVSPVSFVHDNALTRLPISPESLRIDMCDFPISRIFVSHCFL